ncbi:MAG: hypothetical protein Q8P41_25205 [Pseudomonadota bacterium]|nr:hypothetical protein [Pseudomonadota bacterium]
MTSRIFALLSCLVLLLLPTPSDAGSMAKELRNGAALGDGDSPQDDMVTFTLHLGGGAAPIVVTGRDYQSFELFEEDGIPTQLELYHGKGDEKHNIAINLESARYYRLNVAKKYGEWHYEFALYY